jgi:hypothetical protein
MVSALGIGTMRFKGRENAAEMIERELDLLRHRLGVQLQGLR